MEYSTFGSPGPAGQYDAGRQPIGRSDGRYEFFKVRRYGKLHFEKAVAEAYRHDLVTVEALRKEFEIGYSLDHPGIVKYLAYEGKSVFEEYVDGLTLREMIERCDVRLLDHDFLRSVCRQLLDALAYVHRQGVVHLDIKPENVMVCHIGDSVKLIDFGAARNSAFDNTEGYTEAYKAPEQGNGGRTGVQTDIYLVGRLMDELASRAGLAGEWTPFVSKATAEDPRRRFSSASVALAAVPSSGPAPRAAESTAVVPSRKGSGVKVWGLICGLVLLGAGAWWLLPDFSQPSQIVGQAATDGAKEFEQARALLKGLGGVQDEAEGMRLMQVSAQKGDADAQCYLGLTYRDGTSILERDPVKSFEWIRKSAEQGNEIAIEEMGYKYYEGFGVEQDYAEAMKWLKRAAEAGKASAYSSIGIMYRDGEGVEPDYDKAIENFRKGATAGNSYSAFLLARMYGHYLPIRQPDKAIEWYVKASDMGSHRATEVLRDAYTSGDAELGIAPDSVLAVKYAVRLESSDAR